MALGLVREWREERRCLACTAVFRVTEHAPSPASTAGLTPEGEGGNDPPYALRDFCPACAAQLQRRKAGYCPRCGELAVWPTLPVACCARCLADPPPWESFAFHGMHSGLLRRMLIRLKFSEQVLLGHALGALLARHPVLRALPADAVSAVPLHRQRLVRRGYNQAVELARAVALARNLPLLPDLLTRTRNTPPQEGKNRAQRKTNPLGAFAAHPGVRGMRVLLLDDVLTTGATLEEAVRTLLRAGATAVHVAVVSRTARHFSG